ncbi:MAG: B12-binding domain-containing radical SAM protein [Candidatus Omnitrophica bacterium]|nr:B12-binding domain-containing radical SAM protein [Candidatus Omnitrophota bacterium]
MKILLIAPKTNRKSFLFSPPINLCYLKSYLKRYGNYNQIKVIDESAIEYDTLEAVKEFAPDIIGTTCLTDTRHNCFSVLQNARKVMPKAKTIVGGTHGTLMYEQILDNYHFIDFVCVGEGEQTFLEFVQAVETGGEYKDIKGLVFRESGKVNFTGKREFIKNVDIIPLPDYDDIDLKQYKGSQLYDWERNKPRASILSSRGCPFSCIFCGSREAFPGWRARSAGSVVEEFQWYADKFDFECFSIVDDLFTLDEKRAIDICNGLIRKRLNIKWFAQTRADALTKNIVLALKDAGCQLLQIGAESGSPKILKIINKRETLETIENAFAICNKVGLKTQMNLIIGSPEEDQKTIRETAQLIKKYKPFISQFSPLQIFPKTRLFEDYMIRNNVTDDLWLSEAEGFKYNYLNDKDINRFIRKLEIVDFRTRGIYGYIKMFNKYGNEYRVRVLDYLASKPFLKNTYSYFKPFVKRASIKNRIVNGS